MLLFFVVAAPASLRRDPPARPPLTCMFGQEEERRNIHSWRTPIITLRRRTRRKFSYGERCGLPHGWVAAAAAAVAQSPLVLHVPPARPQFLCPSRRSALSFWPSSVFSFAYASPFVQQSSSWVADAGAAQFFLRPRPFLFYVAQKCRGDGGFLASC